MTRETRPVILISSWHDSKESMENYHLWFYEISRNVSCNGTVHLADPMLREKRSNYVGNLESKERLRIQPAQLFNFS